MSPSFKPFPLEMIETFSVTDLVGLIIESANLSTVLRSRFVLSGLETEASEILGSGSFFLREAVLALEIATVLDFGALLAFDVF